MSNKLYDQIEVRLCVKNKQLFLVADRRVLGTQAKIEVR